MKLKSYKMITELLTLNKSLRFLSVQNFQANNKWVFTRLERNSKLIINTIFADCFPNSSVKSLLFMILYRYGTYQINVFSCRINTACSNWSNLSSLYDTVIRLYFNILFLNNVILPLWQCILDSYIEFRS